MAIVTDIGSLNDKVVQQAREPGPQGAEGAAASRRASIERSRGADRIPNLLAAASGRLQPRRSRSASCSFGPLNTVAPKFPKHEVRGHRRRRTRSCAKQAEERRGLSSREQEAGYLVGYLAGPEVKKQGGKQIITAVGGEQGPADRALHQRLHPLARRRRTRRSRSWPTTRTTRPSTTRRSARRPRSARSQRGPQVDLPGRRRLRPRRPRRGEGGGDLGHRRRRRPVLPRPHILTSALKRSTSRVYRPRSSTSKPGKLQTQGGLQLQPEERRRRPRQAQPEAPEGVRRGRRTRSRSRSSSGKIKPSDEL